MKKIISIFIALVLINNLYALDLEMPEKLAENIPGKMVFSSNRTTDGKMYVYLLENGEITNLGFEAYAPKISSNGKYVSNFVREKGKNIDELYIYNLNKKQIHKKYKINNQQAYASCWIGNKYIIYGTKELLSKNEEGLGTYNTYLMKINLKTGEEEILLKYENVGFWFDLDDIFVSPKNKNLITLNIGEIDVDDLETLHIFNIKTKKLTPLWKLATCLGWYPDGKHILIHTNNDGKLGNINKINEFHGRLYKVNIATLETETIQETIKNPYGTEQLTKDGKYIYSARNNPFMTFNLVLAETGDREKEMIITYPIPFELDGVPVYSDDSAPDWWYK